MKRSGECRRWVANQQELQLPAEKPVQWQVQAESKPQGKVKGREGEAQLTKRVKGLKGNSI